MDIVLVGALSLGGFVGYVLGWVINKTSRPGVKSAVAIIGAGVSGAPLLFLEGLGSEKWMYPMGIVLGVLWSRFASIARSISNGSKVQGRSAWYVALAQGGGILVTTCAVLLFATTDNESRQLDQSASRAMPVTASEMPCRLVWIFLGRYSPAKNRYEVPPGFRYLDADSPRSPIPEVGDSVVTTAARNMLVTGYGEADAPHRCDQMLDPPAGYRPETATNYQAGKLSPEKVVLVNQLSTLPAPGAEPSYIWALVGVP